MSETPLTVGVGLHLHKSTRSKDLVELMSDLSLCISHDKIIKIENSVANSVKQRIKENNRVYIPSNTVRGVPIHFAIDNCDFENNTPDGKNEFHGTAQVVIQKPASNTSFPIKIDISATKFKGDFPHIGKIANPVPRN